MSGRVTSFHLWNLLFGFFVHFTFHHVIIMKTTTMMYIHTAAAGLLLLRLLLLSQLLSNATCFSLQSPDLLPPKKAATLTTTTTTTTGLPHNAPEISPATGLKNQFYRWRPGHDDDDDKNPDDPGMAIRYQCAGPLDGEPILLIHGLFVNSDHWRKALQELSSSEKYYGYRVYALDLFGCGYSDKPSRDCVKTQRRYNGENNRFATATGTADGADVDNNKHPLLLPEILPNVELGSANGRDLRIRNVELRHPLGSPYNFYSWSELCRYVCCSNARKQSSMHMHIVSFVTLEVLFLLLGDELTRTRLFS